jgi:hydrogenase maturation protein HypF
LQKAGFRPLFNLANHLGLSGWVRNTSAGVEIEVDGPPEQLRAFVSAVRDDSPPLARIDEVAVAYGSAQGHMGFEILESARLPEAFQPISPDVAVCADCLRELFDPADRRYRYPFINCTNCGPRFTIIEDIPYDRPLPPARFVCA